MNDELSRTFASEVATRLQTQYQESQKAPSLRLSQMGESCPCALWHRIHKPHLAEPFQPWTEVKFSFGHIIEALAISLAKAAGHRVEGEQDEVSVDGIVGHRDCVIDGCIVDVKSAASPSFKKFKDGTLGQDDLFGYLDQLDGYLLGSHDDPLVTTKDRGYLLAVDKQLGHMCLYEHKLTAAREYEFHSRADRYRNIVARTEPPQCTCGTYIERSTGNTRLDVKASYNPYKYCCFPKLRCFIGKGPAYYTVVRKRPDNTTEIDRFGKVVYN